MRYNKTVTSVNPGALVKLKLLNESKQIYLSPENLSSLPEPNYITMFELEQSPELFKSDFVNIFSFPNNWASSNPGTVLESNYKNVVFIDKHDVLVYVATHKNKYNYFKYDELLYRDKCVYIPSPQNINNKKHMCSNNLVEFIMFEYKLVV
jgi:hypothetical protein